MSGQRTIEPARNFYVRDAECNCDGTRCIHCNGRGIVKACSICGEPTPCSTPEQCNREGDLLLHLPGYKLEHRDGEEGERDYLDGRGVHCGDAVELLLDAREGQWLRGRYEIAHRRGPDGTTVRVAMLHVDCGRYIGSAELAVAIPAAALLRWPVRS